MALDEGKRRLHFLRPGQSSLRVLDADTLAEVETVPLPFAARALALDRRRGRPVVAGADGASVAARDHAAPGGWRTATLEAGAVNAIAVDGRGRILLAGAGERPHLSVLDGETLVRTRVVPVVVLPGQAVDLAIHPATDAVLLACRAGWVNLLDPVPE
jgi:hypothetical protein